MRMTKMPSGGEPSAYDAGGVELSDRQEGVGHGVVKHLSYSAANTLGDDTLTEVCGAYSRQ